MADPKGSPEIPDEAVSGSTPGPAGSDQATPARDPELEGLLRSRSEDSEEGLPTNRSARRRSKTAKTGTSLDRKSKRSKLPLVAVIAAGVVVLGGGGFAAWTALAPEHSQVDPDRNKDKTQKVDTTKQADPADEVDAPFNTEAGVFPVKVPDWAQQPASNGITPEDEKKIEETFYGTDLSNSASILPSEVGGFTSDDDKSVNEDGTLNTLYSYWTRESYTRDTGEIIEKFLNPRFGNWEQYQKPGADPQSIDPAKLFPNTFTTDMLDSGDSVRNWLPIYADWNSNNYGRNDLSATGARWYGEITDSTSNFVYDDETSQYTVDFKANVKFTAYTHDGNKVSEKGVLSLEFVANPDGERGPGGKVLVNRSSLTIGG